MSSSSGPTSASTIARRSDGPTPNRLSELIAPGSGAVVMGTGIVSVALATAGFPTFSRALLALAALVWLGLLGVAISRLARDRPRFLLEARSPAGLTGVAGTAVLASRLVALGWPGVALPLLVIGLVSWAVLLVLLLPHLPRRSSGQIFMLTVAAEALASLVADLAASGRVGWLVFPALLLAGAGLLSYPFALSRFRMQDLINGSGGPCPEGHRSGHLDHFRRLDRPSGGR